MTQPDHLTDEQFAQYRSRTLTPVELLDVDEHIARCGACRDRLYREESAGAGLRRLRADFSDHLEYDQIANCANGSFPPDVAQHLKECDMCRAEVDDLAQFREELKSAPRAPIQMPARRIPWRLAAAAVVLLAAALTVWFLRQTPAPPAGIASVPKPAAPTEPALSPDQNAALQLALADHKLERAPILDRLISKRGVLLGAATDAQGFELQRPMGTAVLADRPIFQWKSAKGATSYVVAVFDENFEKMVESPAVTAAEWQPDRALARGKIYNWQVTATVGGKTVHAPTPPAPEARFQVVDQESADRIEAARRDHPGNHTLLAALYAKAGAVEDASRELDRLAVTDPTTAAALRQSLK
jgi:hypothetical protein